jgi:hypothetical protein
MCNVRRKLVGLREKQEHGIFVVRRLVADSLRNAVQWGWGILLLAPRNLELTLLVHCLPMASAWKRRVRTLRELLRQRLVELGKALPHRNVH